MGTRYFRHVANLWSLIDYPSSSEPWSLEQQLDAVRAAATIRTWLAGNVGTGRAMIAVPETGPVRGGYNFEHLPNSWEDAVRLRPLLEGLMAE